MQRQLAATVAAFGLAVLPVRAAAEAAAPVKLTDAELDEVTAGVGPPAFVLAAGHGPPFARGTSSDPSVDISLKNVRLVFNIKDSDVNLAMILQLNLLGNAIQTASATAVQTGG